MASFYRRSGRFYCDIHGFGRVSLGKDRLAASKIHANIDQIWRCKQLGLPIQPEQLSFLRDTSERIRKRLVHIGLVAIEVSPTLGELIEMHEKTLSVKNSTSKTYQQAVGSLLEFFGQDYAIRDIKPQDALEFRAFLVSRGSKRTDELGNRKGLAQATVSRRFKTARSVFKTAVVNKMIPDNPLAAVVAGRQTNGTRSHYVSPAVTTDILNELPTIESRLVFALGRWLGIRLPSEALLLKWSDVNWGRSSIRVTAPKTERYHGKDVRVVPIFREFHPWLRESFENSDSEFLCPHLRSLTSPGQAYTKQLRGCLDRLLIPAWPKLLLNLRASRATEVATEFGPKAESDWIGHGADVAMQSYLMTTDDMWRRATGNSESVAEKAISRTGKI